MLAPDPAWALACDMVVATPRLGWPALVDRIVRNQVPGPDSILTAIDFALHHKEGMLDRYPAALFAEVYHYFRDGARDQTLARLAEHLRFRYRSPWLRTDPKSSPTHWPSPSLRSH
jgi:hypothetical protein